MLNSISEPYFLLRCCMSQWPFPTSICLSCLLIQSIMLEGAHLVSRVCWLPRWGDPCPLTLLPKWGCQGIYCCLSDRGCLLSLFFIPCLLSPISATVYAPHFISQFAQSFSSGASPVLRVSVAPGREPALSVHRLWLRQLHRNKLVHPAAQQLCHWCCRCGSSQPDLLAGGHVICICHNRPLGYRDQQKMLPEVSLLFHMEIMIRIKVLGIAHRSPA